MKGYKSFQYGVTYNAEFDQFYQIWSNLTEFKLNLKLNINLSRDIAACLRLIKKKVEAQHFRNCDVV